MFVLNLVLLHEFELSGTSLTISRYMLVIGPPPRAFLAMQILNSSGWKTLLPYNPDPLAGLLWLIYSFDASKFLF